MNPYLLDLPAVVSFSGGRTSGFMLRKILEAHGGQPEDLRVCFQNTGLEHAATYDFIRDAGDRWGVEIAWLEYCVDADNQHDYKVVDYASASRKGEPFTALIHKKQYLPNVVARFCTQELKILTMTRYLETVPGFDDGYTNYVGLRADEPRRVAKMRGSEVRGMGEVECPVWRAGHTNEDVLEFWRNQDFDLGLPTNGSASNCVGCFLKGSARIRALMADPKTSSYFDFGARRSVFLFVRRLQERGSERTVRVMRR